MYLTERRKWVIIAIAILLATIVGSLLPSITNGQEVSQPATAPTVEVIYFTANGLADGGNHVVVTLTNNCPAPVPGAITAKVYRHTIESLHNGGLGQEVYAGTDCPIIDFVDTYLSYGQTGIYELVLYDPLRFYGYRPAVSGIPNSTHLAGNEVSINHGGFQSVRFIWEYWGVRPNSFQICGAKRLPNGHWGTFERCSPQLDPQSRFNLYDMRSLSPGQWLFVLATIDTTGQGTWLWAGPPSGLELNDWAVNFPDVKIGKEPAPTPIP